MWESIEKKYINKIMGKRSYLNKETDPLLGHYEKNTHYAENEDKIIESVHSTEVEVKILRETTVLKRHLSCVNIVFLLVTSATGAGIFISPTGVTQNVETVGASLVIWIFVGILSLALAFCYCELGTAFPVSGGDYAYINIIFGPVPAFLCLWVTVILLAPLGGTLMAKTATEYILMEFKLHNNGYGSVIVMVISCAFLNVTFATLNSVSVKWSARVINALTIIKIAALLTVIIAGVIMLYRGRTENFHEPFAGTPLSLTKYCTAILPAYVAYIGWDNISTMAEEMKNPKRDLPLGAAIGLVIVIFINVFMNVAYFTVLTPRQFVETHTVGVVFAHQVFTSYTWLIPIFVTLSAIGAITGIYLGYPRYTYAGGKNGQLPQIFSYLHINWCSPFPAIILQCLISVILCVIPFFNLSILLQISGVLLLLKASMALLALLYVKKYWYHLERTVEVPTPIVILCLCILLLVIVMSIIEEPLINGLGCLSFLVGLPFYGIGKLCANSSFVVKYNEKVTRMLQVILMVVPVETDTNFLAQ